MYSPRTLIQRVAVSAKGRSNVVATSSLFSLTKTTSSSKTYSTNRRAPQRKSTLPSPTRQEKIARDKEMAKKLAEPSVSLGDLQNRNETQNMMVEYLEKKITMGQLLRTIGLNDSLFFPLQIVNGHETGAIMRTRDVFPEYTPSGNWPIGVNFEVQNYITLFLFTGENTLRLFEPNTKLKLVELPLGQMFQMLNNEQQKAAVTHIVIDPASASLTLEEEHIMYLPYYRQVAYSEANIDSLWIHSPHSLNPNRVTSEQSNDDDELLRNCTPKLSPFLILCQQNHDLSQSDPSQTGVYFLENSNVLPIWTGEDISNEFPKNHPDIDMEIYKFLPIDGEELWTKLGMNAELMSKCAILFNPNTPQARLFHGKLAIEIHNTPVPSEWKERMQVNKPENEE